jgi:hypothetical protein
VTEDSLDLYDSEVQKLLEILGRLQVRYGSRRATHENLNSMANEAMDLAEKAGFLVTVSVFGDDGQPKLPPEITVHGRVDPELFNFDPDREKWETKKEVANEAKVKKFLARGGTKKQSVDIKSEVGPSEKQAE